MFKKDENRSIVVNEHGDRSTPSIMAMNDTELVINLIQRIVTLIK